MICGNELGYELWTLILDADYFLLKEVMYIYTWKILSISIIYYGKVRIYICEYKGP